MTSLSINQKECSKKRRSITKNQLSTISKLINDHSFYGKNLIDDVTILRMAYYYIQLKHCLRYEYSDMELHHFQLYEQLNNNPYLATKKKDYNSFEKNFFDTFSTLSVIMLNMKGELIYASKSIEKLTGLKMNELIGECIYDYMHPLDAVEFGKILTPDNTKVLGSSLCCYSIKSITGLQPSMVSSISNINERNHIMDRFISINMRLRYTINGKKPFQKLSSCLYNTVHIVGRIITVNKKIKPNTYFSGLIIPLFSPYLFKLNINTLAYISNNQLDMSFLSCNEKLLNLFNKNMIDTISTSFYSYICVNDLLKFKQFHNEVLKKYHAMSECIRLITKHREFLVCRLQGHLVVDSNNHPNHIICIFFPINIISSKKTNHNLENNNKHATIHQSTTTNQQIQDSCYNLNTKNNTKDIYLNNILQSFHTTYSTSNTVSCFNSRTNSSNSSGNISIDPIMPSIHINDILLKSNME